MQATWHLSIPQQYPDERCRTSYAALVAAGLATKELALSLPKKNSFSKASKLSSLNLMCFDTTSLLPSVELSRIGLATQQPSNRRKTTRSGSKGNP